ncbi:hypothetical protein OIU74_023143 [Salix koriyanagi]|uniref:EF-hand domain-containing protein n=1 Tax=Salix koriyanagi TaxID=2511006 RepID=A0A9Q1AAG7_9ROSI|nr:hypothetical protein OIU74_023143 [Salix koriyanagi]
MATGRFHHLCWLSSRFDRRRDDLERGKSLDSDGDGLLALEDHVGLMEAGGGEEKLHDLKENLSLSDILINVGQHCKRNASQNANFCLAIGITNALATSTTFCSVLFFTPYSYFFEKVLVIADDRLVENSLDSDQFFMVLPERKSQGIRVSVSETLNSSSNESY